jgi:hypothetical protein
MKRPIIILELQLIPCRKRSAGSFTSKNKSIVAAGEVITF